MPAEEREPVPGVGRRSLLLSAVIGPALVVTAPLVTNSDAAFDHALTEYRRFLRLGVAASEQAEVEGRPQDADRDGEAFWRLKDPHDDFLLNTPCTTVRSAAIKLRHLLDHTYFLEEPEDRCLRQVLAGLEA